MPDLSYFLEAEKSWTIVKLTSSMLYVIWWILVEKMIYIMIATAEPEIPKKVLIKASEISTDNWAGSGWPALN